jgi:hypothetical protein
MSCGLTCIATNVTAHTEFVNKDNCILIESCRVVPAVDNVWFFGESNWHDFTSLSLKNAFVNAFHKARSVSIENRVSNSNKFIDTFKISDTIESIYSVLN